MPIIDTHCHYNLEPLYSGQASHFKIKDQDLILKQNWQQHWQKAQACDVKKSIIVGPSLNYSQKAIEIAEQEQDLYAAVGIHPEEIDQIDEVAIAIDKLAQLTQSKKVVAIGETGLDYFYLAAKSDDETQQIKAKQQELFIAQIKLANQLDLPLVLHVRDQRETAYFATLELIEQYWQFKNPLIFHCVSGPLAYIKKALTMKQSYFGFAGNITFKKADQIREIFSLVQKTDPTKILLETDSPYLAPEPHRGQICEPHMISQTAKFMQIQLGADLEEIYQNSLRAFKLEK